MLAATVVGMNCPFSSCSAAVSSSGPTTTHGDDLSRATMAARAKARAVCRAFYFDASVDRDASPVGLAARTAL
jgi:hypothetical protein